MVFLQGCPRQVAAVVVGVLYSREQIPLQLDFFALILYLIKSKQKDVIFSKYKLYLLQGTMQSFSIVRNLISWKGGGTKLAEFGYMGQ